MVVHGRTEILGHNQSHGFGVSIIWKHPFSLIYRSPHRVWYLEGLILIE